VGTVLMCWNCEATFEPTDLEWAYVVDEGCPDCGSWDMAVEIIQPRRPR
jgi:Zn finger protein HypA/HybF involved in hydrogenase expression